MISNICHTIDGLTRKNIQDLVNVMRLNITSTSVNKTKNKNGKCISARSSGSPSSLYKLAGDQDVFNDAYLSSNHKTENMGKEE